MKTKLILIRGLPGSGKSTLAKKLFKRGWRHYEADQFHPENDEEMELKIIKAWVYEHGWGKT